MKILIAGKGFIGQAVGEKLSEEHDVKYLDRSDAEYEIDITERFSIDEEFDVLIHTIGLAPGFATKEAYEDVHVIGTENILEGVNADKVVYLSALGAGEVDHPFFTTKKESEEMIGSSGKEFVILRPSTVYGRGNKLLEMIRKFSVMRVFPDVKTETQPILRKELIEIIANAVQSEESQVLDIAGPDQMTVGKMARKVYAEEGRSCTLVPMPEFLIELQLTGLSFLGPPLTRENMKILRSSNTTEKNDAEKLLGREPSRI